MVRNENLKFSIIIAVFNRKEELRELLESLAKQTLKEFEVIVVDDGSTVALRPLTEEFSSILNLKYYYKENTGPGRSRNFGCQKASGDYFIFLDSDTITTPDYLEKVSRELQNNFVHAFGGPDKAGKDFTPLQQAISYSMTSLLTTGGIRGRKKHIGKFQPRSFNMGLSREAFHKTSGFGNLRVGEDPDLSMRIWNKGYETRLFPEAGVFHKRRTTLSGFANQVYKFGVARPILNQRHPQYAKITFWFPSLFLIGFLISILLLAAGILKLYTPAWLLFLPILIYFLYFFLIFIDASSQTKALKIGLLAVVTSLIQLCSYGWGFLKSQFRLNILKLKPETAFPGHFSI